MPQDPTARLNEEWASSLRWRGTRRHYGAEEVLRLRPGVLVEHTLARVGAERLWRLLQERDHVTAGQASTLALADSTERQQF
jgi:isocitrate lyase